MTAQLFVVPVTHSSVCDSAIQSSTVTLYSGEKVRSSNVSWLKHDHQHNSGFYAIKKLDADSSKQVRASAARQLTTQLRADG